MLIQILVDNKDSWIIPYTVILKNKIIDNFNFEVKLIYDSDCVIKGDVLCLLSCEKIFKKLDLNKYNLVVHESFLPKGKGWSPISWQILEGKNTIPVTLFEANKKVDSGVIYGQEVINFSGHELLTEIKEKQAEKTIKLIMDFLKKIPNIKGLPQKGTESFYRRRVSEDGQLDINKSIKNQFNLLRISDNERYPAYFILNNKKYVLKIEKAKTDK